MAKNKTVFVCNECGYESGKWLGKCPACNSWNSFFEQKVVESKNSSLKLEDKKRNVPQKLNSYEAKETFRTSTGFGELDRVLGGGLVKGSLILLGGEPGIGKSTLILQICDKVNGEGKVLYVSGEESAEQIKSRADRLNIKNDDILFLGETDIDIVNQAIIDLNPKLVIIDSIQTMNITSVTSSPGSLTQVRECTNLFMHTAKNNEIPIIIVGHVNKDGAIAGPKVMEHIVDAVLYFEGERNLSCRILRTVKNRYGSTNEIGVFEMLDKGLCEVENPSQMLLSGRPEGVSGTCVTCTMEGLRPILAEVQVLAAKSGFATPRRMSKGYDFNRMAIIIAVMEKRAGMFFGNLDVYLNVVGGFRIDETAGDLAAAMCLYSGIMDKPLPEGLIAFGEVGLGGEVRAVSNVVQRIKEAERMGFDICVLPKQSLASVKQEDFKIKLAGVSDIKQAFSLI